MKKITLILIASMLATVLFGCREVRVNVISDYTACSSNELLNTTDTTSKLIGQKRVETFFGKTIEFTYDSASSSKLRKGDRLNAEGRMNGESTHIASWNADTNMLESYAAYNAGRDRSFKSEVNEFSTEEEFVSYAKSILSPYVSVEGRKVEITTNIFEYDEAAKNYHYRRGVDGFENNVHKVEDFYAEYWFTFYKEINGIRRHDTITISINNTGDVHFIDNYEQENLYKPFLDVKVDMEQAERVTHEALGMYIPGPDCVEFVPSLVATTDGELWLIMDAYVTYGEGTSGYTRVIKVAEIEK